MGIELSKVLDEDNNFKCYSFYDLDIYRLDHIVNGKYEFHQFVVEEVLPYKTPHPEVDWSRWDCSEAEDDPLYIDQHFQSLGLAMRYFEKRVKEREFLSENPNVHRIDL